MEKQIIKNIDKRSTANGVKSAPTCRPLINSHFITRVRHDSVLADNELESW